MQRTGARARVGQRGARSRRQLGAHRDPWLQRLGDGRVLAAKPTDVSETIYLFSIHSPTANNDEPRGGYVAESLEIVLARRHQGLPLPQTLRWNRAPATPYHCDGFLLRGMDVTSVQCESSLRGTSPVRATIAPSCCGLEWLVLANIRMEPTRRTGPCNHGAAGARLI